MVSLSGQKTGQPKRYSFTSCAYGLCGGARTRRQISELAHDPEKCVRFPDKIMRKIKDIERASVSKETDRALKAGARVPDLGFAPADGA